MCRCLRDSSHFCWRAMYHAGLRTEEAVMLDVADLCFDRGPFGKIHVRYGKAAKGSGPRRRTSDGGWEPDPAAPPDRIDWAAFVTEALAGATANAGGIDNILAGRPGSWEAAHIRDTLVSTVGHDESDLMRHRTEPVDIVLKPEQILYDLPIWSTWAATTTPNKNCA